MWQVLREVAATMREMLRAEAAIQLKVPSTDLQIQNGVFVSNNNRLTFGEVVKNKEGQWDVPKDKPVLKPQSAFTIVGQPLPRVDLPDKVTGQTTSGYNARLPGMLYGVIAQPLTLGAKLRQAGSGTAASQPGVVKYFFCQRVTCRRRSGGQAPSFLSPPWHWRWASSPPEAGSLKWST